MSFIRNGEWMPKELWITEGNRSLPDESLISLVDVDAEIQKIKEKVINDDSLPVVITLDSLNPECMTGFKPKNKYY
jgi:hypothetical protein